MTIDGYAFTPVRAMPALRPGVVVCIEKSGALAVHDEHTARRLAIADWWHYQYMLLSVATLLPQRRQMALWDERSAA